MSELSEDLAAFAPASVRSLKFQGRSYAVRAFLDLTVLEAVQVVRRERDTGMTQAERLAAEAEEVALLVPGMAAEVLQRLTPRQLFQIASAARELSGKREESSGMLRLGFRFAQAARFYGWDWPKIRRLTVRQLQRFLGFIPELQARERLEEALVAAFPHLESGARQEIHRRWLELSGVVQSTPDYEAAWSRVGAFLRRGGNA